MKNFVVFICFLVVQACSDSQIGKKLANSFEDPLTRDVSSNTSKKNRLNDSSFTKAIVSSEQTEKKSSVSIKKKPSSSIQIRKPYKQDRVQKKKYLPKKAFKPKPYRIVLKLKGANPSAPAEALTTALRNAGVIFEIEKIERYEQIPSVNKSLRR
ncbi:hypothetical protein [Prochlorococcus marinus]|uniref:hypothetical protein n=1 Tax=Prochlorococcus marinus TaxID=1219 RepID=UPI0022B3DB88|nr:hypothetical protein [Prochlorococcus marinus]